MKERYGAAEFIRAEHISLLFVISARMFLNPQTNSPEVFGSAFYKKGAKSTFFGVRGLILKKNSYLRV